MKQGERIDAASADTLLKRFRRKMLFDPSRLPAQTDYGVDIIRRLLPHREPLLFVDRITGIDLDAGRIAGRRWLAPDDPVFAGHFPGVPLYPGTFQVEMAGQLGLCLYGFDRRRSTEPPPDGEPLAVRATRILGAYYGEPVRPDTEVVLLAQVIAYDGYFASMIGQCLVDGKVASVSAGEVLFLQ